MFSTREEVKMFSISDMLRVVKSKDRTQIENGLVTLNLDNKPTFIRMIILTAPELIEITYPFLEYYDQSVINALVRSRVDFSPIVKNMSSEQIDLLFWESLLVCRFEINEYLLSNGYLPRLNEVFSRLCLSEFPSLKEMPIKWLLEKGARPSYGDLTQLLLYEDHNAARLIVDHSRDELPGALEELASQGLKLPSF